MDFKNETDFRNWLQCELSKHGIRAWRNNTGVFFTANGTPTRAGLCKGSADLIGIVPIKITEQMVGSVIGVFLSAETKSKHGTRRPEQVAWAEMVNKMGGIAIFVKPGDDFLALLKR